MNQFLTGGTGNFLDKAIFGGSLFGWIDRILEDEILNEGTSGLFFEETDQYLEDHHLNESIKFRRIKSCMNGSFFGEIDSFERMYQIF